MSQNERPASPSARWASPPRWGLIADDLTGACDAAVQFALRGFQTIVLTQETLLIQEKSALTLTTEIAAISTDSRDDSADVAAQKSEAACRLMASRGVSVLFKKIDSTLRGNVGVETQAVMAACGFAQAVVNPAFPAMGRTLVGGSLRVHGVQPEPPCHLQSMLPADPRFLIEDAASQEELSHIARAALGQDPPALLVGSAGLAREAAAILGNRFARPCATAIPETDGRPLVFVVGSVHDVTAAQVRHLIKSCATTEVEAEQVRASHFQQAEDSGAHLVVRVPLERFSERAMDGLVCAIESASVGGLFVTGGDTARLVCNALRVEAIHLRGETAPGIPWGVVEGGPADGLQIVTKSGGFGDADALVEVADRLSVRRPPHVA